jgi:hypothetical protein
MGLATTLLADDEGDDVVGAAANVESLRNPEPNFYILGAKSYGTNSNFLLQIGHRQVRDAYRLITGDEELDLYE